MCCCSASRCFHVTFSADARLCPDECCDDIETRKSPPPYRGRSQGHGAVGLSDAAFRWRPGPPGWVPALGWWSGASARCVNDNAASRPPARPGRRPPSQATGAPPSTPCPGLRACPRRGVPDAQRAPRPSASGLPTGGLPASGFVPASSVGTTGRAVIALPIGGRRMSLPGTFSGTPKTEWLVNAAGKVRDQRRQHSARAPGGRRKSRHRRLQTGLGRPRRGVRHAGREPRGSRRDVLPGMPHRRLQPDPGRQPLRGRADRRLVVRHPARRAARTGSGALPGNAGADIDRAAMPAASNRRNPSPHLPWTPTP